MTEQHTAQHSTQRASVTLVCVYSFKNCNLGIPIQPKLFLYGNIISTQPAASQTDRPNNKQEQQEQQQTATTTTTAATTTTTITTTNNSSNNNNVLEQCSISVERLPRSHRSN